MSESVFEHDVTEVAQHRKDGHDSQKDFEAVEVVSIGLDAEPEKEIIDYGQCRCCRDAI